MHIKMNTKQYDEQALQEALTFLSANFTRSGSNPKPIVLHSVRVASMLIDNKASQRAVLAALLHDILEDTDVPIDELSKRYGQEITGMVKSLTHKKLGTYSEKLNYALESYRRSNLLGFDTLIVRACDIIDNSEYYPEAVAPEQREYNYNKFTGFMEISKTTLAGSVYWTLLEASFRKNVARLRSLSNANK